MTGEGLELDGGGVQPGGRQPAPGPLALVQAFINSFFDLEVERGADLFATPDRLAGWLAHRELLPSRTTLRARDRTRAIVVREGLRDLAAGNNGASDGLTAASLAELNRAAAGAGVEVRLAAEGPRFAPTGSGLDRALGVLLAITATAMLDGTWPRLKACPGHDCGWAFYDHSRNQTGRWCSMSVCGGRAKARAHYQRRREEDRRT
ncbi:MAG: CGNR zinc finger domain-containing protein [Solirubrobacteraceae bacterium]